MTDEKKTYSAKIYKLVCSCCEKFYVGSTKQRLSQRLHGHRFDCANPRNQSKLYTHMRTVGIENFRILQIVAVEVKDRDELRAIEDRYIREMKSIEEGLNEINAILSVEKLRIRDKRRKDRNKAIGKYKCDVCDYKGRSNVEIQRHLKTDLHHQNAGTEIGLKEFVCNLCSYSSNRKHHYQNHLKSQKHLRKIASTSQ